MILDAIGYVHTISPVRKSENSTNKYFDVELQVAKDQYHLIRLMANDTSKRKLFSDKKETIQPVVLSNLNTTPSGTTFLTKLQH